MQLFPTSFRHLRLQAYVSKSPRNFETEESTFPLYQPVPAVRRWRKITKWDFSWWDTQSERKWFHWLSDVLRHLRLQGYVRKSARNFKNQKRNFRLWDMQVSCFSAGCEGHTVRYMDRTTAMTYLQTGRTDEQNRLTKWWTAQLDERANGQNIVTIALHWRTPQNDERIVLTNSTAGRTRLLC